MRTRLIAIALVLAAALPAQAEDRALAERFFRLGEKAYQAQNFEAAAQNFEEAYKQFPLAEIAFSAAQAYRRQYRIDPKPEYVALAVKHYKAYLGKVKSGGRVADAADALSELQQELERLIKSGVKVSEELARDYTVLTINPSIDRQSASTGMQEVADDKPTASTKFVATLDGKSAEPFAPINVSPGKHTIVVSAEGFFSQTKVTNVQQGSNPIIDIDLVPKPAKVTIKTESGSRILVDGRPQLGTVFELPAGRHVISVLHRGRVGVAREVTAQRGQALVIDQPLEKTTRRHVVPWLLGATGVTAALSIASLAAAIHYDNVGSDKLALINEVGNQDADVLAEYENARIWRTRHATAAWTMSGATVLLGGLTAVLYYTDMPSPDGVRVEPVVTANGAGAVLSGRF